MLYKRVLILILSLLSLTAWPQKIQIKGIVKDYENVPIPFCTIEIKGSLSGFYADENGAYTIDNINVNDTLVFSCVGYEKKEASISSLYNTSEQNVRLKRNDFALNEISVRSNNSKAKYAALGEKLSYYGEAFMGPGNEFALYFKPNAGKENGYLKKIYIYICEFGIPDTKFRVHVYADDTVTLMPGIDITDSNVIAYASTKGAEWVEIDISQKQISVQGGFFISVEWIDGYGNNNKIQELFRTSKNFLGKTITPEVPLKFQGMVLGQSKNKYGRLVYTRKLPSQYWYSKSSPIIPMIYATYSYYK